MTAIAVKETVVKLRKERDFDALTQILNRRSFQEYARKRLADLGFYPMAVLACDIGHRPFQTHQRRQGPRARRQGAAACQLLYQAKNAWRDRVHVSGVDYPDIPIESTLQPDKIAA